MILDSESVALFYDGLSTHTSYKALQFIDECGWIGIKNVAYSYFDNPMQYVLGHINLHLISNLKEIMLRLLVLESNRKSSLKILLRALYLKLLNKVVNRILSGASIR